MYRLRSMAASLMLMALLVFPATAQDAPSTQVLAASPNFTSLVAAVEAAGLAGTLAGEEPLTIFAPTDDAFEAALDALGLSAEELFADTETLASILTYHVVEGVYFAEDVIGLSGESIETVNGESIAINVVDGGVLLNQSVNILTPDVEVANGVIHVVDTVLFPPVFSAVTEILDDAIEAADEPADQSADEPADEMVMEDTTILDVLRADEELATLLSAIEAAGLDGTLAGEGPFTVFAPTNAAFAAALDTLGLSAEELFGNSAVLNDLLTYHVVPDELFAASILALDGSELPTVNGATILVRVEGQAVILNESITVTAIDIEASNGVVHILDGVLVPANG